MVKKGNREVVKNYVKYFCPVTSSRPCFSSRPIVSFVLAFSIVHYRMVIYSITIASSINICHWTMPSNNELEQRKVGRAALQLEMQSSFEAPI